MKYIILSLLTILLCTQKTLAQDLITDRPDQTESATTVPKHYLQWEVGTQYEEANGIGEWALLSNLFRYGVSHKLELRLITELINAPIDRTQIHGVSDLGVSDLQVGVKYQFIKRPNLEVAYLGHLVLPSGSAHLTTYDIGTVNRINIAHGIGENFSSSYNFGYELYEGGSNGNFIYTWSIGASLTEKLGYYIELYGGWEEFENWTSNISTGFAYLLKENLQLDFSIGSGITQRFNYYNFGMSWRIPH